MKRTFGCLNIKKNYPFLIIIFLVVLIELFVIFDNTPTENLMEVNNTREIALEHFAINNSFNTFYQWKTYPIHYYFSNETYCGDYYKERMIKAFKLIEEDTDYAITFYEGEGKNAIKVVCENKKENEIDGAAYAITYINGKEITSAEIHLFKLDKNKYIKNGIETETHEILHTLNFEHVTDKESIMNPIGHDYDIEIDEEIINCIKYIYTKDNNYNCNNILFSWNN